MSDDRLYSLLDRIEEQAGDEQMVMALALALRGKANAIREKVESAAAGYLRSSQACAEIADLLGAPKP